MLGPTFGIAAATSLIMAVLPYDFISNNEITTDGKLVDGISRWLTEFTRSVVSRNFHSYNNYWRPYLLFSALAAGWSFTLFEQARSIFNTQLDMALVLLIDVKTNPTDTWPLLVKQLDLLRKR
ncbi:hypothetical protein CH63R_10689 [Colletotrichum higginsianum IMI 349063]|uniref:Uncharacterized protein n=1 Tax=Colletotrichum higginsianum (strain IMI 349063) TaxID=759273 RepID=A0A1B7Y3G7_COLHI|nr:uncharacterized protein CH63R_10689 [Colletotrichum higginsianum IMI 349063]OBR06569.1 hypothetical protein CH63R_10689 [Colletotrichum higginsianum IMI 349063]